MKTFEDFIRKETSFDLPDDVLKAVLNAHYRFEEYLTKEKSKSDLLETLQKADIVEVKWGGNPFADKGYTDAFHPPKEIVNEFTKVTIIIKNHE